MKLSHFRISSSARMGLFFELAIFPLAASCASDSRPLALHPDNPHYFVFRGKPVVLITSAEHYGAVLNLDFNYIPYLDELHAHGLNHTRTFSGTYREVPTSFGITENTLAPKVGRFVSPWARSSTPGCKDGGNKFDLKQWDENYFKRLRDFVGEAGKRGIVVEMNLFCPLYEDALWEINPMNSINNVNGIGNCPRTEVYTLGRADLTQIQKAVTQKIIESLSEFDNVYYEVCNEPWFGNVKPEWQNEIIATIVATESTSGRRHLISQNVSKQTLTNVNPAVSIFNFHYAAPPDVVSQNYDLKKALGDNETGFRGKEDFLYRGEAWDFLMAGGSLYSSLDYSFTASHPGGDFLDYESPGGGTVQLRKQLGILKDFLDGFNFIEMAPNDSLITGGLKPGLVFARALARPGNAYAIYLRARANADRFHARWTGSVLGSTNRPCTFHLESNQGVRLWVNEKLVIDNSRSHGKTNDYAEVALAAGTRVPIRLELYQARLGSIARLSWSASGSPTIIIPTSQYVPPDGVGHGLKGEYFEDRQMNKLILTRNDLAVDFDWSKKDPFDVKTPGPVNLQLNLPAGNYHAEWLEPKTGRIIKHPDVHHAGGNITLESPAFAEDIALRILSQAGKDK